jgi:ABC-2 type transport system permease protein
MSNAITEEREERAAARAALGAELAPSVLREDEPQLARTIGLIAVVLTLFGADLLCWAIWNKSVIRWLWWGVLNLSKAAVPTSGPALSAFGNILGTGFFIVGLGGLLYHGFMEKDAQLRRSYGVLGVLWLVLGIFCLVAQIAGASWAGNLLLPGVACLLLGLLFTLDFLHNETEGEWQRLGLLLILGLGVALAGVGFLGTAINAGFLLRGFALALLGLAYFLAFALAAGRGADLGVLPLQRLDMRPRELVAAAVGAVGVLVIVLALFRTYVWPLFFSAATRPGPYMIPTGLVLCTLGLLYVLFFVLLYVENPVVAMTRRELTAFFYSPIAYLVLFAFTIVGWLDLIMFLYRALPMDPTQQQEPVFEPIVRTFFFGILPVFAIVCIVPFLTMRALSEEKRTGTLELLLTVPVDEWTVVLSKFLATLVFFLLIWVPWALFLLALYLMGKESFDFRPLLSFLIVLVFTGAHFVSMGLFFSSITRNQIISAVLTFAGMLGLFFVYFAIFYIKAFAPGSAWVPVLNHMSFVDLWFNSLDGKLQPVYLLFHLSATIFWLFLTVKVLEARRWS